MVFPAAGFDGLQVLDVQQPGPLIDYLLKMPQAQPLPGPFVDENVPLLPVPHIMAQHFAGIAGQLHGFGGTGWYQAPEKRMITPTGTLNGQGINITEKYFIVPGAVKIQSCYAIDAVHGPVQRLDILIGLIQTG